MQNIEMNKVEAYLDTRSQFVSVDGMRVHFKREGRGPTVLLLHGSGSSLHCFDGVVHALQAHHEVVRLDLPGFGLTGPRPDRDYRIETYVSFLQRFMSALSITTFSLVGNSLGGNIAWNFALDHPEQVRHLVLMNATGYPEKSLPLAMRLARNPVGRFLLRRMISRRATERNLRQLVGSRTPRLDDALVDRVYTFMSQPGNLQAFIDQSKTPQRDRSSEIPRIVSPTLILRGQDVDGQHFARDIPGSRETVFQGAGRLLPDEIPAEVAAAIQRHIG